MQYTIKRVSFLNVQFLKKISKFSGHLLKLTMCVLIFQSSVRQCCGLRTDPRVLLEELFAGTGRFLPSPGKIGQCWHRCAFGDETRLRRRWCFSILRFSLASFQCLFQIPGAAFSLPILRCLVEGSKQRVDRSNEKSDSDRHSDLWNDVLGRAHAVSG